LVGVESVKHGEADVGEERVAAVAGLGVGDTRVGSLCSRGQVPPSAPEDLGKRAGKSVGDAERVAEDRVEDARGQHRADGVAARRRRERAVEAAREPRVGVVDRLEVQPQRGSRGVLGVEGRL